MKMLRALLIASAMPWASGCSSDTTAPAFEEAEYVLDFSGDIVATGVPARANRNDLWGTLEITTPVAVTLPATLLPENDKPFHAVNWPPPAIADIDPTKPFDLTIFPFCTYSETNALRHNQWGANARTWSNIRITVTTERVAGGGAEARIDLSSLLTLPGGSSPLLVAARDVSPHVSDNTLQLTQGQAFVAAMSPDPHADPCITVTITATPQS